MGEERKSPTRKEWHHGFAILLLMLIAVSTFVSAAELLSVREDVESIEAAVERIEATEKARIEQAAWRHFESLR